jgi:hypothetical protein
VAVALGVFEAVTDGVRVMPGVSVTVGVFEAVADGVRVMPGVSVTVGVAVSVSVAVAVADSVEVGVVVSKAFARLGAAVLPIKAAPIARARMAHRASGGKARRVSCIRKFLL